MIAINNIAMVLLTGNEILYHAADDGEERDRGLLFVGV
jgi:hypothetical protein